MTQGQIDGNCRSVSGWFSENWPTAPEPPTSSPTSSARSLSHPGDAAGCGRIPSVRGASTDRMHLRLLSRIFPLFLLALLCAPMDAEAQGSGCCRFSRSCTTTSTSFACVQAGGAFEANSTCNSARGRCVGASLVVPRLRRPTTGRPSFRPVTVQVIRPHGPHVVLVPAVTATPQPTPTATATPRRDSVGCCQLAYDNVPFCSAPTDRTACNRNEGYFVADATCNDDSGICRPVEPQPVAVGCCQQNTQNPSCANAVSESQCNYVNGLFVDDAACSRNTGFCVRPPLPRCGDGVIESGEECEYDADCRTPAEGCTDSCLCAGGLEVLLRWTNQNDVDLTVIDPLGNVYVPSHDANPACRETTNKPEEFVFLPPGRAPIGCYTIRAHYDHQCPETRGVDTHLDLRLNVEGTKSTIHVVPGGAPGSVYEARFGLRADCR